MNALAGSSADGNQGFGAALASLMKVTQFKNTAQLTRVQANQPSRSERLRQQEESKMEKVKPKQAGKGQQSIKVQSKNKLERVKSIETDEISQKNIKPKSLKPEEIEEHIVKIL